MSFRSFLSFRSYQSTRSGMNIQASSQSLSITFDGDDAVEAIEGADALAEDILKEIGDGLR